MPSPTTLALFSIGGSTIANVGSATLTLNQSSIDITDLGSTYKKYSSGLPEGVVEIECFWDATISAAFATKLNAGTLLSAVLVQWGTGVSISGDGIVESCGYSVAPNGVAQGNATIRFGNSAITVDNT